MSQEDKGEAPVWLKAIGREWQRSSASRRTFHDMMRFGTSQK
jgi:hypothetical protein